MCLPIDDAAMLCWLKTQATVHEAWREELAVRPDSEPGMLNRLELHHAWLEEEISRLDHHRQAA